MDILKQDVRYLKGVGEKRRRQLYKLDVHTVEDLLYLLPRRYTDYSDPYPIAYAPYDEPAAVLATVLEIGNGIRVRGGRVIYRVLCRDETARLTITFFNSEYTVKQLHPGEDYIFYGKAEGSMTNRQMSSPIFIKADAPVKKRPVYPLTAGLSQKMVSKYMLK